VAAREEEGGGTQEAAARVWEFRLLQETATNMFIASSIRSITSFYIIVQLIKP
jgi:hypothetical protein